MRQGQTASYVHDYGFRSLSPSGQRFPDKSYGQSMLRTTSYD